MNKHSNVNAYLPVTAFDIRGANNERVKLEITEVYEFPQITSVYGGYDIKCRLQIDSDVYRLRTDDYYSATGMLWAFFKGLNKCYSELNGKCSFDGDCEGKDLSFDVYFAQGRVVVCGKYQNDRMRKNILEFEFCSDQSYFASVLTDLRKVVDMFGDNRGLKDRV